MRAWLARQRQRARGVARQPPAAGKSNWPGFSIAAASGDSSSSGDATADHRRDDGGTSSRTGGVPMPLNEYPSGTSFPGVIGRTADESTPAWPAPVRAPKDAPNVLFIVLDDTGFGQLGCLRQPDRDAEPGPPGASGGCATTTCTRRRCARRAGRASSPAATITATRWRASPRWRRASRATTA